MDTTAWAEIRLAALRHNAGVARQLAPHSRMMAMVKAGGYGHGLLPVTEALSGVADGVAVARLHEAKSLREGGYTGKLLLLGTLLEPRQLLWCSDKDVAVEIHTLNGARDLAAAALPRPLEVWLKLNSGMNRLGMPPEVFIEAHRLLEDSANVTQLVHMSHFSSAENLTSEATRQQIELMSRISSAVSASGVSMANSAGIIAHAASHAQWIRPGIMLYGDNPLGEDHPARLQAVMQFKSRVIALHDVPAGGAVGYHATWRAETPRRIAAVGVGYGDGYPRSLPNGTPVLVRGQRVPLCGRVSMDIISVDVSDLPEPARIGDEVLLWGEGLPAGEIAALAGTISYELFTGVAPRVQRLYRDH